MVSPPAIPCSRFIRNSRRPTDSRVRIKSPPFLQKMLTKMLNFQKVIVSQRFFVSFLGFESRTGHQKEKTRNPLRLRVFLYIPMLSGFLCVVISDAFSHCLTHSGCNFQHKTLTKNANGFASQCTCNTHKAFPPGRGRPCPSRTPAPAPRRTPAR